MKKIIIPVIALTTLQFSNVFGQVSTFSFTGTMQTYTVPSGVTSINVEAWGAEGNNGLGTTGGAAGLGGYIQGDLLVTPGLVLNIFVGGQDGYNEGGIGGTVDAGNGGGATDIRIGGVTLNDRVVVAGGGGGGGAEGCGIPGPSGLFGGAGGAGGGETGTDGATSDSGGGGFAGSLGLGGDAGIGCGGFLGLPGDNNGAGGDGQGCCCATTPGGGGGGGGYVNGGGGGGGSAGTTGCSGNDKGGGGGGAGGSSFLGTMSNGVLTNGLQSGDGLLIITATPSGVSLNELAKEWTISPNPTQGKISVSNPYTIAKIIVVDLNGKEVHVQDANFGTVDLPELNPGVYLMHIFSTTGSKSTEKIQLIK